MRKNTPQNIIDKYNYKSFRYYLFCHSYLVSKIRLKFLNNLGLKDGIKEKDWFKFLLKKYYKELELFISNIGLKDITYDMVWATWPEFSKKIFPKLYNFCIKWNIDFKLFVIYLLYKNIPYKLDSLDHPKVVKIYPNLTYDIEEGCYIKVSPDTTEKELYSSLRWAKILLSVDTEKESSQLNMDKSNKKRKDITLKDKQLKGKAYIKIEKEIAKIVNQKLDKNSIYANDFDKSTVRIAIERVSGSLLEGMNLSDEMFTLREQEWRKILEGYYYDITRRYNLPTFKQSTSILRDIDF